MKTLYRAIALEDVIEGNIRVERKGEPMSGNYTTKEEVINRMKQRASYTAGIPFRVEEVYIVEEGDDKK